MPNAYDQFCGHSCHSRSVHLARFALPPANEYVVLAASGEMIIRYLGHPVPQCQQASRRFGRSDCCNNPTPGACAEGGWPQFDHWGFNFRSVRGALTFDQLQHEINANRPIAFSWLWIDGDSGHMWSPSATTSALNSYTSTIPGLLVPVIPVDHLR